MNRYAFIDFDGTISRFTSLISFELFWQENELKKSQSEIQDWLHDFNQKRKRLPRKELNMIYFQNWKGRCATRTSVKISEWYESINIHSNFNSSVASFLSQLKNRSVKIVIVSGSYKGLIKPFAQQFGIDAIISNELQIIDKKYTGKINIGPMVDEAKMNAVLALAKLENINLETCYAIGDHISDESYISLVGHPMIVPGNHELEQIASLKNYKILPNE